MLINRMIAFREFFPELKVDIIFFHDAGGLRPLQLALSAHSVNAHAFVANGFEDLKQYDVAFCIDCPQAFQLCERKGIRCVIECHSGYLQLKGIIKNIPKSYVSFIVVPSDAFSMQISKDVGGLDIMVLRNFIPDIAFGDAGHCGILPGWSKRPLFFFSRMDKLKNPEFLLDAFVELEKKSPRNFFVLMCGAQMPDIDMRKEIDRRGLSASVMLLPAVDFLHSADLMQVVKGCGGIFISPSKNESFGLSAAEAISIGIPTLLSDIPAHRVLVNSSQELLFPLDEPEILADKIICTADQYDVVSSQMLSYSVKFSRQGFIDDWVAVIERLDKGK